MKRVLAILLLMSVPVLATAQGARNFLHQQEEDQDDEPLPSGEVLMHQVRSQLPFMPLRMKGFIRTRRKGEKDYDRLLVSELRFGDPVPHATYTLADGLGAPLTQVKVSWPQGKPFYEQWDENGNPLPAPNPLDEVADTGLTWSDLSLGFLWWDGAEVTGRDRVKTRSTYVVKIPAPKDRKDVADVELWVDKKALFIVKAELLDKDGKMLKRIEVDSIKEIREDFWMVKDLLIRDRQNGMRIGIRFLEVEEVEAPDEP